jgi:hypothetical protein
MRRNRILRWRHIFLARIGRRHERALVDLSIALLDLPALIRFKLLQFLKIRAHRIRKIAKSEWEERRIGQPHHRGSRSLRQRAAIHKIGIGKVRVPVEIVVNGVIHATAPTLAPEPEIQRRDAQVIDKRRVVRS